MRPPAQTLMYFLLDVIHPILTIDLGPVLAKRYPLNPQEPIHKNQSSIFLSVLIIAWSRVCPSVYTLFNPMRYTHNLCFAL